MGVFLICVTRCCFLFSQGGGCSVSTWHIQVQRGEKEVGNWLASWLACSVLIIIRR